MDDWQSIIIQFMRSRAFSSGLLIQEFRNALFDDFLPTCDLIPNKITITQLSKLLRELYEDRIADIDFKHGEVYSVNGLTRFYEDYHGDIEALIIQYLDVETITNATWKVVADHINKWGYDIPTELVQRGVYALVEENAVYLSENEGRVLVLANMETDVFSDIMVRNGEPNRIFSISQSGEKGDLFEFIDELKDVEFGYITDLELQRRTPENILRLNQYEKFITYLIDNDICIAKEKEVLIDPRGDTEQHDVVANIIIPDINQELLKYFQKHPNELYTMHPRKFEELIAEICKYNGLEVVLTPPSKDGGYDILAIQSNRILGDRRHLIQCKRYKKTHAVGVEPIYGLFGVVNSEKAHKGICVTTSRFTRGAIQFANANKAFLELKAFDDLVSWLADLNI